METPLTDELLTLKLRQEFSKSKKYLLRKSYGEFLSRYPWEWFVTLTFVESVHPEEAFKKWRLWVSMINRQLHGPRWSSKPHGGVYWVVSIEYQKRGVIHFHALMIGVRSLRRLTWMDKWQYLDRKTGFARIEEIKHVMGASMYVSKYLAKGGEVFFSDNLKNISDDLLAGLVEPQSTHC